MVEVGFAVVRLVAVDVGGFGGEGEKGEKDEEEEVIRG